MDMRQLGRHLAAMRALADFTQQQLADKAQVTQATIARIERGGLQNVRVKTLCP